jgi:hypothetical protein
MRFDTITERLIWKKWIRQRWKIANEIWNRKFSQKNSVGGENRF